MQQQELFGHLSIDRDRLFLDDIPIEEDQVLLVKWDEGKFLGRARVHLRGGWYLDCEEFVGHTYLNIKLSAKEITEMRAQLVGVDELAARFGIKPRATRR